MWTLRLFVGTVQGGSDAEALNIFSVIQCSWVRVNAKDSTPSYDFKSLYLTSTTYLQCGRFHFYMNIVVGPFAAFPPWPLKRL